MHVLFNIDNNRQGYRVIVCDLIADGFGHWSVKCRSVSGGVAEVTVGAVNCSGDEFIDFGIAGDWVFDRDLFAFGVARHKLGADASIARIGEIVLFIFQNGWALDGWLYGLEIK